jgi:hypothetical protein
MVSAVCANCVSNTEAVVAQAVTLTALARAGLVRGRDRLRGQGRTERRLAAHRANAEFLAGMGLDPEAVLGPPPQAPEVGPCRPIRVPLSGSSAGAVASG